MIKPIERKSKRDDRQVSMVRCTTCGKLFFRKEMSVINKYPCTGVCRSCYDNLNVRMYWSDKH